MLYENSGQGAYKVGMCHLWSMNAVPVNWKLAVKALKFASKRNIHEATSLLAICHHNGYGLPYDQEKAGFFSFFLCNDCVSLIFCYISAIMEHWPRLLLPSTVWTVIHAGSFRS